MAVYCAPRRRAWSIFDVSVGREIPTKHSAKNEKRSLEPRRRRWVRGAGANCEVRLLACVSARGCAPLPSPPW